MSENKDKHEGDTTLRRWREWKRDEEKAGQEIEQEMRQLILSDEEWEAWERLQEERAEEEYHERRYAEKMKEAV